MAINIIPTTIEIRTTAATRVQVPASQNSRVPSVIYHSRHSMSVPQLLAFQKLLPAIGPDTAFQLAVQLIKALSQHCDFVRIEPGHQFAFHPVHELLDILVDLATLRRKTKAGATPVTLVHVAVNQSA